MHESAPLLAAIQSWASTRPDIVGLLFVGSHGRGTPGPYSEVAVVVLTTDPARYRSDKQWHAKIAWPRGAEAEGPTCEVEYGRTWSRHVALTDLRLVQFTFALPSWADTAPIDPGTYLVVGTVRQILWDPEGRLARLSAALEPGVVDDPAAAKEFMRSWEGAEESYSQWAVPPAFTGLHRCAAWSRSCATVVTLDCSAAGIPHIACCCRAPWNTGCAATNPTF